MLEDAVGCFEVLAGLDQAAAKLLGGWDVGDFGCGFEQVRNGLNLLGCTVQRSGPVAACEEDPCVLELQGGYVSVGSAPLPGGNAKVGLAEEGH